MATCVKQLFANNASALLAASITDVETTVQVDSGYGQLFPNPGANEYFVIALENSAGDIEICKVTSRTTDLLTVVRGWDGTTAQAWTGGVTRVEARNTKGSMERFIQRGGDTMECDLDMDGNSIIDPVLDGTVVINEPTIIGGTWYNSNGDPGNAITVPDDGTSPPTVGGSPILTRASFDPQSVFTAGMIMMFYGDVSDIPDGWALCDGNNGRPDLRNRFIVGVGSDYVLGDVGGSDYLTGTIVANGGAHDHGTTGEHTLTVDELPAHSHRIFAANYSGDTNADGWGKAGTRGIPGEDVGPFGYRATSNNDDLIIEETGGGEPHTHTIGSGGAHTHDAAADLDNRPPYYALYFIIKTDPDGDYGGVGGGGGGDGSMYDMYNENGCTTFIGGQSTLMDDLAIASGNVQINCCASNVFRLVLTENVTMLAPNNPLSGQVINVILKQGGVGGYTVSWPANFKFPGGAAPTLSTAVGAKDIITCQYDSADNEWLCVGSQTFS